MKHLIYTFLFLFNIFECGFACMATGGGGGGDIPITTSTTTTTTTTSPCALAADNAGVFLTPDANLVDNVYGMVPATGEIQN